MTVRWVVNETAYGGGLALLALGGLLLIVSGFLVSLPLTVLAGGLIAGGGILLVLGVRPHPSSSAALPRVPAARASRASPPLADRELPVVDAQELEESRSTVGYSGPTSSAEIATPGPGPAGSAWTGLSAAADVVEAVPGPVGGSPPLVPEEPPWPPSAPEPPAPAGPTTRFPGPTPGAGTVAPDAPGLAHSSVGTPEPVAVSSAPPAPLAGRGPSEELPALAAAGIANEGEGSEPLAEPDASPTSRWGVPSLPFAAATDRSQAHRGPGASASEMWPPVLDRAEEDLREEVERLRQRVEELSTPVLVPGFTVLPSPIHRDALGLISRVPEPPTSIPRATGLCSACGDADPPGPSGGHRCWGCGRAVCSNCFWRYGPGPTLHRCPSCAAKSPALTISGGRRSLTPGGASAAIDEPEWSEGL